MQYPRRVFLSVWFLLVGGVVVAAPVVQRIHGDVVAITGAVLQIRSSEGEALTVKLADGARLTAVSRADAAAISSGAYVGATAVPQPDGTLAAVEVHIFPESMRGTGEGYRPMDAQPGRTMTNATVAEVSAAGRPAGNTMTNATVASITAANQQRRLTLQYKGGEKVVTLGADVPVVMLEPGDRSMLVPGAHIVVNVVRQDDGSLTTDRITIGKNGMVPPL
ncbi:MAG: hypothetical protein P4L87_17255 [Formivibrio sp.]|nr:hypothetical protein [Formivibrio sp.]